MATIPTYKRALLYIAAHSPREMKVTGLAGTKVVKAIAYVWGKAPRAVADDVLALERRAQRGGPLPPAEAAPRRRAAAETNAARATESAGS